MTEFEAVIGLEIHTQLATESKIFCSCPARLPEGVSVADIDPNANTCPICAGHPGTLPILNKRVLEYAVRAGLATGCTINRKNVFARKNYFYPDMPKGYQISQYDKPICENGFMEIETSRGKKRVTIQRIHMEEDAGKSIHHPGYSSVNLNRAGTPLVEIVSGPDMSTPEEAGAYMRALYAVVTHLGICDGNLQEGNFRCDANVSVRPKGSDILGTRTEIKNVNSFRFVEKAIEFEIARQIGVVSSGGKVIQETRLYDAERNKTITMRTKEEAEDYRYFPDPDLVPVVIDEAAIDAIRATLPELPQQLKARYMSEYALPAQDAEVVVSSKPMVRFFEEALKALEARGVKAADGAKSLANFLNGEVNRLLNESGIELAESRLRPNHLAELAELTIKSVVSSSGAKQALGAAWETGESIGAIVEREGLRQVSDLSALEPAIDQVIAGNPAQVADYQAGKEKLLGFFVGQVMKQTGGKANPALVGELIKKKLGRSS